MNNCLSTFCGKARSGFRLFALLAFLGLAAPIAANAAMVRGRLDRVDVYRRHYPAQGIAVTLYNQTIGRSSPSYTDMYGMYYLYNVPAGSYYLEVWVSRNPNDPPRAYQIQVREPYTDIPAIVVP
jgi:hypothetical protein